MKVTLEFDLNNEVDELSYKLAMKGEDLAYVLYCMRDLYKTGMDGVTAVTPGTVLQAIDEDLQAFEVTEAIIWSNDLRMLKLAEMGITSK